MWGGDDAARARAKDWVAKRVADLGLDGAGAHEVVEPVFTIDSDNVAAAQVFMGMASQWRVTSMSSMAGALRIKEGLDYTALPVVAGALGHVLDKACFEGLQELERATLGLEAEAAPRDARKSSTSKRSAR